MVRKLKIVDIVGQLLCLVIPILLTYIYKDRDFAFTIYFSVGGWQLLSFIISAITMKEEQKANMRKVYGVLLLLTLASSLLLVVDRGIVFLLLYGYLIFTPIMAVMYFAITVHEMRIATSFIKRDEFVQKR